MKEYRNLREKFPFPVYGIDINNWDELESVSVDSTNFVILLLADYSAKSADEISEIAVSLIDKGLKYICCWGKECGQGDTAFDIGNILWEERNNQKIHIPSTWHDEPLQEAIWYCLYLATPDDEYWSSCSTLVINIANEASSTQVDSFLSDVNLLESVLENT